MRNQLSRAALVDQAVKINNIEQVIDLVSVITGTDGSLAALFLRPTEWKLISNARRRSQVESYLDLCYMEHEHRASGALIEIGAAEAA